jgi:damage-control phosphatase, subfamily III
MIANVLLSLLADTIGARYETVLRRWPVIITGVVDQMNRENHALHLILTAQTELHAKEITQEKLTSGKQIIEKISKLKYEMARDHVMKCVAVVFHPVWAPI